MKYKLVPVNPTREMWAAAGDAVVALNSHHHDAISEAVYKAMLTAAPAVDQKPTLVAWILYNATTDVKYIKMCPSDGSLAIFDNEEAAMSAKRIHSGTEYKRCEYYSAPQPTPDVAKMVETLERLVFAARCRDNSTGCQIRLIETRAELSAAVNNAKEALSAYRQQGGDV